MCDYCPEEESTEHFLKYCQRYQEERDQLESNLQAKKINNFSLQNLLSNQETVSEVEYFIKATARFE